MTDVIKEIIDHHEEEMVLMSSYRRIPDNAYQFSSYFTSLLQKFTNDELNISDIFDEVTEEEREECINKLKPEDKDEVYKVVKYRGYVIPFCNDDNGQQVYTIFDDKYMSSGSYGSEYEIIYQLNVAIDSKILNKEDR